MPAARFFRFGACVNADPATLLARFDDFGSRRIFAALEATLLDVLSFLAMLLVSMLFAMLGGMICNGKLWPWPTTVSPPAVIAGAPQHVLGKIRVNDGDTISYRIRLFGIDTPELRQRCKGIDGQCYDCGERAQQWLKDLTDGKDVECRPTGAMTYGRPVAICYAGGEDIGLRMVRDGWAVAYRKYLAERPDLERAYLVGGTEARRLQAGIWQGDFVAPSDWRNRGQRLEGCE